MKSRTSFAARTLARSPQQIRSDWNAAVVLAGALASAAGAEQQQPGLRDPQFGQNLTRLVLTARALEPGNFPVQAESARSMAAAFLKLARDFCHPGWSPQARTACAPFLRAGARCLDDLINDLRTEEARGWRGQLGERDED